MFNSSLVRRYKTHLLLALLLVIGIIALRLEVSVVDILSIVIGIPLGMILLDGDYFFFSYITDPNHHFSQMVKSMVTERNWKGLLAYFLESRYEPEKLVLHSALFQVILIGVSLFALMSSIGLFQGCLVVGLMSRMIFDQYQQWRVSKDLRSWFWNLNIPITPSTIQFYLLLVGAAYLYSFLLLIRL